MRLATCALVMLLVSGCGPTGDDHATTPTIQTVPSAFPTEVASAGCTVVEVAPTPTGSTLVEPGSSDYPPTGPANAAVTMLFYCDLQSQECEIFNRALDQLLVNHSRDLRVIQRLYPVPESAVPSLDKSVLSAQAAIAASRQGKFWEMRDLMHARYEDWIALSSSDFRAWLIAESASVGLDPIRFAADLESPDTAAAAAEAYRLRNCPGHLQHSDSIHQWEIAGKGRAQLQRTGLHDRANRAGITPAARLPSI